MRSRTDRSDEEAARAWESYLGDNLELIRASGLPQAVFSGRAAFELFLMHSRVAGASYHLETGTLSERERAALKELVIRYIRSGFDDPGVSLFTPTEDHRLVAEGIARRNGTSAG